MRDEKKWGDEMRDKKNGELRCETKKMGRRDARQKKWGDEMRDEKKMERQDARQNKIGRRDARQKKWNT